MPILESNDEPPAPATKSPSPVWPVSLAALLLALVLRPFAGERPASHEPDGALADDYAYWQQLCQLDGLPLRPLMARFLRRTLPQLKVLSHAEVPDNRNIRITAMIGGAA